MSSKYPLPYHLQSCCGCSTPWRRANQNCVTQTLFGGGDRLADVGKGGVQGSTSQRQQETHEFDLPPKPGCNRDKTEGLAWDSPALKMVHVIVVTLASSVGEVVPTHGFVGLGWRKQLLGIPNMKHKHVSPSVAMLAHG